MVSSFTIQVYRIHIFLKINQKSKVTNKEKSMREAGDRFLSRKDIRALSDIYKYSLGLDKADGSRAKGLDIYKFGKFVRVSWGINSELVSLMILSR
jgi:hypothetical protein